MAKTRPTPQKSATSRSTRNSRGEQSATPAKPTTGRITRASSITSDDGNKLAATPTRRSRRLSEEPAEYTALPPTTRRRGRQSRETSVVSDNGAQATATHEPSPSVEPAADQVGVYNDNQNTAAVTSIEGELPPQSLTDSAPVRQPSPVDTEAVPATQGETVVNNVPVDQDNFVPAVAAPATPAPVSALPTVVQPSAPAVSSVGPTLTFTPDGVVKQWEVIKRIIPVSPTPFAIIEESLPDQSTPRIERPFQWYSVTQIEPKKSSHGRSVRFALPDAPDSALSKGTQTTPAPSQPAVGRTVTFTPDGGRITDYCAQSPDLSTIPEESPSYQSTPHIARPVRPPAAPSVGRTLHFTPDGGRLTDRCAESPDLSTVNEESLSSQITSRQARTQRPVSQAPPALAVPSVGPTLTFNPDAVFESWDQPSSGLSSHPKGILKKRYPSQKSTSIRSQQVPVAQPRHFFNRSNIFAVAGAPRTPATSDAKAATQSIPGAFFNRNNIFDPIGTPSAATDSTAANSGTNGSQPPTAGGWYSRHLLGHHQAEAQSSPKSLFTIGIPARLVPAAPSKNNATSGVDAQAGVNTGKDKYVRIPVVYERPEPDPRAERVQSQRAAARREYKLKHRLEILSKEWKEPQEAFVHEFHPVVLGEEPDQSTEKYRSFKAQEGACFGRKLLQAIKAEHAQRGCVCPLPQVYSTRFEAEKGQGTLRFFRGFAQTKTGFRRNVGVFMRKDDWRWHCVCNNKPLSDFALWVRDVKAKEARAKQAEERKAAEERQLRKRKIDETSFDAELEESNIVRVTEGPSRRRRFVTLAAKLGNISAPRSARYQALGEQSSTYIRSARSMCGTLGIRTAITMATSVKNLLSRITAQLSNVWSPRQAQAAIESRIKREDGELAVKRFKRQAYVPIKTAEEQAAWDAETEPEALGGPTPFDDLPWFEWTDDPTKYIGRENLRLIYGVALRFRTDIDQKRFMWAGTEEEIRRDHADLIRETNANEYGVPPRKDYDLELSVSLHRFARLNYHLATPEDMTDHYKKRAVSHFWRSTDAVIGMMKNMYLNAEIMTEMKESLGPKPPKHLRFSSDKKGAGKACLARNFMSMWLAIHPGVSDEMTKAVKKFIVDMDALHKMDVPNSLVDYPGKYDDHNDVYPGSWPTDVMEVVSSDAVAITPIYELQFPDSPMKECDDAPAVAEMPGSPSEAPWWSPPASPSSSPLRIRRGIMKKARPFPERRDPRPGDKPRQPVIQFKDGLRSFGAPKHKPHHRVEKTRAVPQATRDLYHRWARDIGWEANDEKNLFMNRRGRGVVMPFGAPEDQTMEEAGGWRMIKDKRTGELRRAVPPTKYEQFLEDVRNELFDGGIAMSTADLAPPQFRGLPMEPKVQDEEPVMIDAHELWSNVIKERPKLINRFPPQTVRQILKERDDLLSQPDELPIATKMLEAFAFRRQLREEEQAAAERREAEIAKKKEQEARQKAEEEARRRAEEQRRAAEAERRRREAERRAAEKREQEEQRARMGFRTPSRTIITHLPPDWASKVNSLHELNRRAPTAVVGKIPDGTELNPKDIVDRLIPQTAWLNDNVIIGSILHIGDFVNKKAGAPANQPKCATFTSYFWPRLLSAGPTGVARLMRRAGVQKENFKDIDSILIPICSGSHWTLGVVRPQLKTVMHMDSLRGGRGDPKVTATILNWVRITLGNDFDQDAWKKIDIEAPTQSNGYDCGVFSIMNGLCIALGLDPQETYRPSELTTARSWIAGVLLNGGFKGEFSLDDV